MSYAIKLCLSKTEKNEDSLSHFFGSPIVPESMMPAIEELDGDVMFFGQLALEEIAAMDPDNKLPHEGQLYIFLDTYSYPYEAICFHTCDEPKYILDDFNAEVTDFEAFTQPFAATFAPAEADAEGTKLFGETSWDCGDDRELLLQFDPLDNDTGFLLDVDGYAYFRFGDKERTPENITFDIDRS